MTDGEQRAALAVVRSLGRAGHTVYVCSGTGRSLAGASRYARADLRMADPMRAPERFVDDVVAAIGPYRIDTLIPITEPTLLAILPARGRVSDVLLPFATDEAFRAVSDKAAVLAAAARLGIAVPAQHTLDTPADAKTFPLATLQFPIVVKPARSIATDTTGHAKFTVQHASDAGALREIFHTLDARAYPVLLQQRIVGPGVGLFLLVWDGDIVAAFSHRRLREKPPAGGVSVYAESIPLDPELTARSRALLDTVGWRGVAMVEYKIDARTGVPYLMEINGRFWGSLQLAVDAGVDFPALLLQAASGHSPAPVTVYRVGARNRWEWGDIDHLLTRLRHSDRELALPPGSASRPRAVLAWLRSVLAPPRGERSEVFRWTDPRPFIRESRAWVSTVLEGR